MGRAPQADVAGEIYHALNRGNARHDIFFKPKDFEAFERIVAEALSRFSIKLATWPVRRLRRWVVRVNKALTSWLDHEGHWSWFVSKLYGTASTRRVNIENLQRRGL